MCAAIPASEPESGMLLIASPILQDPNFARSVVFVIDHREDGTTGVILNRPSQVRVLDVLPQWSALAVGSRTLFVGGPVEKNAALCLARRAPGSQPAGWTTVTGQIGLTDLDGDPARLGSELHELRIFAGYSGWGRDQLQREIGEGAWFVVPALPSDVFADPGVDLWREVLRRQTGSLALLSSYPDDPHLN
ncbi:MAG TPA: YqgE/AlgH family protein [Mycobacteriales bacterium]|nr:YqgE/AlgH family protein [Mycobacteriales bacterium]